MPQYASQAMTNNLLGAALALVGLVGPLLAALLMPASSLTVILSSVTGRTFGARSAPLEASRERRGAWK